MLDTVCKHHLSGAFTSGHETRGHSTPTVLAGPVAAERVPGSARLFGAPLDPARVVLSDARRPADPERVVVRQDALRVPVRIELATLV